MNERALRQEARLMAIETMVIHIYNALYRMEGVDEARISAIEDEARSTLAHLPVQGLRPEISDMVSSEILIEIERLWAQARDNRTQSP